MALTLGTNAYTTLQGFKDWCSDRGYSWFDFDDSTIESAIVVVSVDFIDANYAFKGTKLDSNQVMQLPTNSVTIASVSPGVNQAVWQQLNGQLLADLSTINTSGEIASERKKLDVMESETQYREGSRKTNTISTVRVTTLLKPYIVSGYNGMGGVRIL